MVHTVHSTCKYKNLFQLVHLVVNHYELCSRTQQHFMLIGVFTDGSDCNASLAASDLEVSQPGFDVAIFIPCVVAWLGSCTPQQQMKPKIIEAIFTSNTTTTSFCALFASGAVYSESYSTCTCTCTCTCILIRTESTRAQNPFYHVCVLA